LFEHERDGEIRPAFFVMSPFLERLICAGAFSIPEHIIDHTQEATAARLSHVR
jgi:hypothetical protein